MSRSPANAAASVERFFQFALWGLVVSGYLAVAGSGYLDAPTVMLTGAGLLARALLISGALRFDIPFATGSSAACRRACWWWKRRNTAGRASPRAALSNKTATFTP